MTGCKATFSNPNNYTHAPKAECRMLLRMYSISRKTKGAREAGKETLIFGLNANVS